MKHTIRQVFHSGKFVVGFSILVSTLFIVFVYPLVIKNPPLQIIGQGTFFPPGIYVNAYDSIKAFSETDFTEDLKKFDIPTLVMHGDDDQIVPVKDSAKKSAQLIKGAVEIYYPGLPHGLTATHADIVNRDLLAFIQQGKRKVA